MNSTNSTSKAQSIVLKLGSALCLLFVFGSVGCGSDDDDQGSVGLDDFPHAAAKSFCAVSKPCCDEIDGMVYNELCIPQQRSEVWGDTIGRTTDKVGWNDAAASACLQAIQSLSGQCTYDRAKDDEIDKACSRLTIGLVKVGDSCTQSYECEGYESRVATCVIDFSNPEKGECMAYTDTDEGDTCDVFVDYGAAKYRRCREGLACVGPSDFSTPTGTCKTPAAEGEACMGRPCEDSLYCDYDLNAGAGACRKYKKDGETCETSSECASGACRCPGNNYSCDVSEQQCGLKHLALSGSCREDSDSASGGASGSAGSGGALLYKIGVKEGEGLGG